MQFRLVGNVAAVTVAWGVLTSVGTTRAQTVLWAQMGGGAGGDARHYGVVGQALPAGVGDSLRAGFLAHPLFLNLPPLTQDTSVQWGAGAALAVGVTGADVDGQVVAARVVVPAAHGTGSFSGTTLNYSPTDGFRGSDSVGFEVVDNQGAASDTAWVRISVTGPVALAARPVAHAFVGSPDVRVPRLMVSRAANELRDGLTFSRAIDLEQGLSVTFLLAGPSQVRVQIYDNLGTLVTYADADVDDWTFRGLPTTADGRRQWTARWDLRDRSGAPVPEGVYLWRILIDAQDGQKLETVRKTGVKQ